MYIGDSAYYLKFSDIIKFESKINNKKPVIDKSKYIFGIINNHKTVIYIFNIECAAFDGMQSSSAGVCTIQDWGNLSN